MPRCRQRRDAPRGSSRQLQGSLSTGAWVVRCYHCPESAHHLSTRGPTFSCLHGVLHMHAAGPPVWGTFPPQLICPSHAAPRRRRAPIVQTKEPRPQVGGMRPVQSHALDTAPLPRALRCLLAHVGGCPGHPGPCSCALPGGSHLQAHLGRGQVRLVPDSPLSLTIENSWAAWRRPQPSHQAVHPGSAPRTDGQPQPWALGRTWPSAGYAEWEGGKALASQ